MAVMRLMDAELPRQRQVALLADRAPRQGFVILVRHKVDTAHGADAKAGDRAVGEIASVRVVRLVVRMRLRELAPVGDRLSSRSKSGSRICATVSMHSPNCLVGSVGCGRVTVKVVVPPSETAHSAMRTRCCMSSSQSGMSLAAVSRLSCRRSSSVGSQRSISPDSSACFTRS